MSGLVETRVAHDISVMERLADMQWAGLGIVAAAFASFALIEWLAPARAAPRGRRWVTNLTLYAIDTLAVRLLIPLAMVGTAIVAAERGWGLLNQLSLPVWLGVAVAILALDLALYVQHWATHRVPMLWRLHKVHHCDPAFDVTTAARFHPVEIVLSMVYKCAVVAALGLPALGVFAFELIFTIATLFTHANFALPPRAEAMVRRVLVTPDLHRIHHSARMVETNSNYGTLLSGWDRLFGSYCGKARHDHVIGLEPYQDTRPHRLGWSLALPFRGTSRPGTKKEQIG